VAITQAKSFTVFWAICVCSQLIVEKLPIFENNLITAESASYYWHGILVYLAQLSGCPNFYISLNKCSI
jgi:hypothetical protein